LVALEAFSRRNRAPDPAGVQIVSCDGDKPIAGSISDYLFEPNAGVIEFLLVSPGQRKSGLASQRVRR
jgi:hypothetical protein